MPIVWRFLLNPTTGVSCWHPHIRMPHVSQLVNPYCFSKLIRPPALLTFPYCSPNAQGPTWRWVCSAFTLPLVWSPGQGFRGPVGHFLQCPSVVAHLVLSPHLVWSYRFGGGRWYRLVLCPSGSLLPLCSLEDFLAFWHYSAPGTSVHFLYQAWKSAFSQEALVPSVGG